MPAKTVNDFYKQEIERRVACALIGVQGEAERQKVRFKATKKARKDLKSRRQRAYYFLSMPVHLRPKANCVMSAKQRLHRDAWVMATSMESPDL